MSKVRKLKYLTWIQLDHKSRLVSINSILLTKKFFFARRKLEAKRYFDAKGLKETLPHSLDVLDIIFIPYCATLNDRCLIYLSLMTDV